MEPSIRQIQFKDVQVICSQQSVIDLATAVKELVENAIVRTYRDIHIIYT